VGAILDSRYRDESDGACELKFERNIYDFYSEVLEHQKQNSVV
jgi:hypothetical protein